MQPADVGLWFRDSAGASRRVRLAFPAEAPSADTAAEDSPTLAVNLLDDGPLRRMRQDSRDGGLALAFNLGGAPVRVAAAELVDSHNAELFALGGQGAPAPATVEIPPHSARLMRCRQP